MPPLPVLSGQVILRAFERLGWTYARRKGSHMVMTKPGNPANLSIPDHKEVDAGTLRDIIRVSGIDAVTFLRAAKK